MNAVMNIDLRWPIGLSLVGVLLAAGLPAVVQALDYSGVPGEVLDYVPVQYDHPFYTTPRAFVADPEIVVLPNGNYLAAYALSGRNTTSDTSGETTLFRSTDKGATWSSLGTYTGILRGSLFVQNGDVYLYGANDDTDNKPARIMMSTNSGTSWTSSEFANFAGMGTPNNPVVWSNRCYSSGGTASFYAPTASNLMIEASWKLPAGFPADRTGWLSGSETISEGQVVASPNLGVFILPKVGNMPYAALSRVNFGGTVTFDPTNNFVALPGGEKKFGAAYDTVSSNFYVLSNPVLPAHTNRIADLNAAMIRNTAAVLTSRDLLNWKVEKIFLYSTDVDRDGFGYLNFDFDDTNMAVIARTAFQVPGASNPERGHDSNLLTFHRLDDFRNLSPDQYLTISGNQILRYERTQYQSAPLGSFTMGNTFAGAALNAPNGMGQTASGEVYVRETGGRILHFDSLGNFIETNSSAPVTFQSANLTVTQPTNGECSWVRSGSGDWADMLSWYYWGRPDTTEEIAVFGSAATAATTITIPSETQTWNFNSTTNEGWATANASDTVVSGGYLQGTANTNTASVQISRTDRFFYGSAVPEVRIRLSADANCKVVFYWGTPTTDTFAAARSVTNFYSGNGTVQELVFPMAGNANWDGKAITRLRFDPLVQTNSISGFAVDSITVPRESSRMKGLRFRAANSYTLSGGGQLRIESGSGAGTVEVLQGRHTNDVALILGSDTEMTLTNSTSLHLKQGIDLNGKRLRVTGAGKLLMQGALVMNGGTLSVSGTAPLAFTNNLTGAVLDGTLQFLPEGSFAPTNGTSFNLLDNESLLGTNRFTAVSLPVLDGGLQWNTNSLYSAGSVSVEAVRTLTVTTPYGNASPVAGTNTYA